MAKKLYEENNLNQIALALQEKNGTSNKYYVSEMAQAVRDLIWEGTQAEYDLISPKNPTTLYIIVEEEE